MTAAATREVRTFSDLDTLSSAAADEIVAIARASVAARGRFTMALAGGKSVVCCDTADSPWLAVRPSVRLGGIRAIVCVPLAMQDGSTGVIYVDSRQPGPPVTELDLELVESVAGQAATAIEDAINGSNKDWKKKNIVLIGYSFGADVSPFMLTHFSPALNNKINHLVLLSPSEKTDFEIHVMQMFGWGKNEGESVPAE